MTKDQTDAFLLELSALTRKYGIEIHGYDDGAYVDDLGAKGPGDQGRYIIDRDGTLEWVGPDYVEPPPRTWATAPPLPPSPLALELLARMKARKQ